MGERVVIKTGKSDTRKETPVLRKQETVTPPTVSLPVHITFLQRTIGNKAVRRMYESGMLQAKLKIVGPNDIYEQEADRVAEQVMTMPDAAVNCRRSAIGKGKGSIRTKPGCPSCGEEESVRTMPLASEITPLVRRQVEEDEEVRTRLEDEEDVMQGKFLQRREQEEETLRTKSSADKSAIAPAVEGGIRSLRGGGQPMSESIRAFFEPRFGADFSGVRIHTDSNASNLAKSVNARAFTLGRDIVFGSGQYSPNSPSGRRLLTHELAHVLQGEKSRGTIRLWSAAGHKEITLKVGRRLNIEGGIRAILSVESTSMDKKKIAFVNLTSAPDHGECKGYRNGFYICRNKKAAAAINEVRQKKYLDAAIHLYNKYHGLRRKYGGIQWDLANIRESQRLRKDIYSSLGDALHITQDRAAHGEGVRGAGHCKANPDKNICDDPKVNWRGYIEAVENTVALLNEFDRRAIVGIIRNRRSFFYKTAIRRGGHPRRSLAFQVNFDLKWHKPKKSRLFFVADKANIRVSSIARYIQKPRGARSSRKTYLIELHGIHYGRDFNHGTVSYKIGRRQYFEWKDRRHGYYYIKLQKEGSIFKIFNPVTDLKGQAKIVAK